MWLQYGSKSRAAQLDRGGEAFRHPDKVLDLSPFGAKLQPTEGARNTLEWQPLHNLQLSPPRFHDDSSLYSQQDGLVLAPGVARQRTRVRIDPSNALSGFEEVGQPPNDDGTYQIEKIVSARKVGNKWHVLIKWVGWAEPTEESRTWMYNNCDDPEILADIERCITSARLGETVSTEYGEVIDSASDSDADNTESVHVVSSCEGAVVGPMSVDVRVYLVNYLRFYRSMC